MLENKLYSGKPKECLRRKKIKLIDVRNWLKKQKTYSLHKPIRRKFSRRQTIVAGIDHQWQADLTDLSHLSKYNNKYRNLLCVSDVFSNMLGSFQSKIKRDIL